MPLPPPHPPVQAKAPKRVRVAARPSSKMPDLKVNVARPMLRGGAGAPAAAPRRQVTTAVNSVDRRA